MSSIYHYTQPFPSLTVNWNIFIIPAGWYAFGLVEAFILCHLEINQAKYKFVTLVAGLVYNWTLSRLLWSDTEQPKYMTVESDCMKEEKTT